MACCGGERNTKALIEKRNQLDTLQRERNAKQTELTMYHISMSLAMASRNFGQIQDSVEELGEVIKKETEDAVREQAQQQINELNAQLEAINKDVGVYALNIGVFSILMNRKQAKLSKDELDLKFIQATFERDSLLNTLKERDSELPAPDKNADMIRHLKKRKVELEGKLSSGDSQEAADLQEKISKFQQYLQMKEELDKLKETKHELKERLDELESEKKDLDERREQHNATMTHYRQHANGLRARIEALTEENAELEAKLAE